MRSTPGRTLRIRYVIRPSVPRPDCLLPPSKGERYAADTSADCSMHAKVVHVFDVTNFCFRIALRGAFVSCIRSHVNAAQPLRSLARKPARASLQSAVCLDEPARPHTTTPEPQCKLNPPDRRHDCLRLRYDGGLRGLRPRIRRRAVLPRYRLPPLSFRCLPEA